jgi:hypothetical protein
LNLFHRKPPLVNFLVMNLYTPKGRSRNPA